MHDESVLLSREGTAGSPTARLISYALVVAFLLCPDDESGRPAAETMPQDTVWTFDQTAPGTLPETFSALGHCSMAVQPENGGS